MFDISLTMPRCFCGCGGVRWECQYCTRLATHYLNDPSPELLCDDHAAEWRASDGDDATIAIPHVIVVLRRRLWRLRALTCDEKLAGISPERRREVFEQDFHRCRACGTTADLTVDHILPGGTNMVHNLQTLCRSCNSKKGTGYKRYPRWVA